MRVHTSRFGDVELKEEEILTFPEGILGFNSLRKFILVDDPKDEIFAWLQSCENPGIAFPVLEPELFMAEYNVSLSKLDYEVIGAQMDTKLRYFNIITIPDDPTQMTANLKAPLVVNVETMKARQSVLQDNNLAIREPIFARLQQRVVQNPATSLKSRAAEWGVAIKLEPTPTRQAEV